MKLTTWLTLKLIYFLLIMKAHIFKKCPHHSNITFCNMLQSQSNNTFNWFAKNTK